MENQPHTKETDQITLPEVQSANESNPVEFSGSANSEHQTEMQALQMNEVESASEPDNHQEELKAITNKHGKTQFLIKGKNTETGATYHRFASKNEVHEALGVFDAPTKNEADYEETEAHKPKHLAKNSEPVDQEQEHEPMHMAVDSKSEDEEPDHTPKHSEAPFEIPADRQAIYEKIDAEAAEGKVEDLKNPDESTAQAMDRFFEERGLKTPELKTDEELDAEHPDPYDSPVLKGRNDEDFWAEVDKRESRKKGEQEYEPKHLKEKKFARLRKSARQIGRRIIVGLGLADDPNQGPTIQAPNRREEAPVAEAEPTQKRQETMLPKPEESHEETPSDLPSGAVRIHAERASEEDEKAA